MAVIEAFRGSSRRGMSRKFMPYKGHRSWQSAIGEVPVVLRGDGKKSRRLFVGLNLGHDNSKHTGNPSHTLAGKVYIAGPGSMFD